MSYETQGCLFIGRCIGSDCPYYRQLGWRLAECVATALFDTMNYQVKSAFFQRTKREWEREQAAGRKQAVSAAEDIIKRGKTNG